MGVRRGLCLLNRGVDWLTLILETRERPRLIAKL